MRVQAITNEAAANTSDGIPDSRNVENHDEHMVTHRLADRSDPHTPSSTLSVALGAFQEHRHHVQYRKTSDVQLPSHQMVSTFKACFFQNTTANSFF